MGSRADREEDGRLPVAQAGACGRFEFVEWTGEGPLRHTTFVALRDDKDPRKVTRE